MNTLNNGDTGLQARTIINDLVAVSNRRVYKAMLAQSSTSAPVASIRVNTLLNPVTYQYVGVGGYLVISEGAFVPSPIFNLILPTSIGRWTHSIQDANSTYLQIFDLAGNPVNGYLSQTALEIEIWL